MTLAALALLVVPALPVQRLPAPETARIVLPAERHA